MAKKQNVSRWTAKMSWVEKPKQCPNGKCQWQYTGKSRNQGFIGWLLSFLKIKWLGTFWMCPYCESVKHVEYV